MKNIKTIFIFVPDSLELDKIGYLEGYYEENENWEAFYITNNNVILQSNCDNLIGSVIKEGDIKNKKYTLNFIIKDSVFLINNLRNKYVEIFYNYEAFKKSDILDFTIKKHGPQFKKLMEKLKNSNCLNNNNFNIFKSLFCLIIFILNNFITIFNKIEKMTEYSATISHFKQSLIMFKWFFIEWKKDKKLTTKTRNFLVSKIIDLTIGIILLVFFLSNKYKVLKFVEHTRETTIDSLKELLQYLRGSPIGLKLNYSFNNCLGKFFFYHIFLWRVFLQEMQPYLSKYFEYVVFPAIFGFSYQIAMFSDIISIATFHVYCIYVYAARLIYFQLLSILSLFRLFIGRKFNPLRDKIDSYQYTQDQLFIGTLGFTILLFLLPTTALYYTVFTSIKLVVWLIRELLNKIRNLFNDLPIYIIILWFLRSTSVSGNLNLVLKRIDDADNVIIEAQLKPLPLKDSILIYTPSNIVNDRQKINWSKLIGDIFTGVLI